MNTYSLYKNLEDYYNKASPIVSFKSLEDVEVYRKLWGYSLYPHLVTVTFIHHYSCSGVPYDQAN